ncbi:SRPBCC family protein [Ramlibacter sp. AW1]|uniref:SRPBCC family protein n=2 Tax=Ramlibacter aurantiacus TaxID=2801330 RepID=A0A937D648_9BURK|nr:SRPBCC family protein [Ramlibacter aurantiacus]
MPGKLVTMAALAVGGMLLSKQMKKRGGSRSSSVEESIEVNVPASTAYNQWTQFEEFPKFMSHLEEVRQLDDTHLRWRASVGGKRKEWVSEITEQVPDKRIAWRSTEGIPNSGVVTFHHLTDTSCKIMLQLDYEPGSVDEQLADAIGGVRQMARANLKKFKQLIEERGVETGAWRGTVTQH